MTDNTVESGLDETAGDAGDLIAEGKRNVELPDPPEEAAKEPPEETAKEPDDGSADGDLTEAVERFDVRLEESQRLLARQSDLVDRLHLENQELRAGELRNAQLPLVRDLLRLHDDVGRMREAAGESDHDLRLVQESLSDTLARNGVETFSPGHGDPFDPRFHAAAGVEPAENEALDKTVAEVVRQGFRWESGDTIRVAEVRAYRYRGAA